MKTPEKKHYDYDKEIDFLCEECLSLAKDIIEMDEDIEGLTDWSNEVSEHLNKSLENIEYNFEVLDKRTKGAKENSDVWYLSWWIFALIVWNILLTCVAVFNYVL